MTIKTDAWHVRFYKSWHEEELPNNLCSYFWWVAIPLVLLVVFGFLALWLFYLTGIPSLVLGIPWIALRGEYLGGGQYYYHTPWDHFLFTLAVIGAGCVIVGIVALCHKAMVWEFLKGIKERYCPVIEWEGDYELGDPEFNKVSLAYREILLGIYKESE